MHSLESYIDDNLTRFEVAQQHVFEPFRAYYGKNVVLAFTSGYHSLFLLHVMLYLRIDFTLAYVRQANGKDDRQFEHVKAIAYRYGLSLEIHERFRSDVCSYPVAVALLLQGLGYTKVVMGSVIDSSYDFHDLWELEQKEDSVVCLPIGKVPTFWLERAYLLQEGDSHGYTVISYDCLDPRSRFAISESPSCGRCEKCQEQIKIFGETVYQRRQRTPIAQLPIGHKRIPTNYFHQDKTA